MSAHDPLLSVNGLHIALPGRRGMRELFRNLSFSLRRGEVLALIGQSGCGKTTLARAIARLLPPHIVELRGNVSLNGRAIYELNTRELRTLRQSDLRMVFQDPSAALNPTMKVGRQLVPIAGRSGEALAPRHQDVVDLLRQLKLDDPERCLNAYPFELSGGMQQRVMIAASLLADPSLIVADEPTSALDPVLRNRVLEMFIDLARARRTGVLLVTHDLPLVSRFADRALLLEDGTIVDAGTPGEILRSSRYSRPTRRSAQLDAMSVGDDIALCLDQISIDVPVRRVWPWQRRRHRRILDNVELEVRRGEILGLLGASGAGKTTLARCVLGFNKPTAGSIVVDGASRELGRPGRTLGGPPVQIIYQNPYSSLSPKLNVHSIVVEPLLAIPGIDAAERDRRFRRIMADVGLDQRYEQRRPGELSGGQRQRVAIARCLIADPAVVVADEPVSSLDTVACNQVLELLARLRDSYQFACLFISHELDVLRVIADRIAVMERGRIVECNVTRNIFESPAHPVTVEFVSATLPA